MKNKILFDLRVVADKGFCGIGQDSATTFKYLSSQTVDLSGLFFSSNPNGLLNQYKNTLPEREAIEQATYFFHEMLNHEPLHFKNKLAKIKKLFALTHARNKVFDLIPTPKLFDDVIWRNSFSKYVEPEYRQAVLKNNFYYSNLHMQHISSTAYLKHSAKLNTDGFDFVVFPELRPVAVSKNTKKIIRYHDAIPITDPDFTPTGSSMHHIEDLKKCAADSYFVCNSDPTREMLLNLYPQLEKKSFVIPCTISYPFKKNLNAIKLKQIMMTRLSDYLVNQDVLEKLRKDILQANHFDYILNIATFDPKKNLISLIKAWEKLNFHHEKKIKLVVLANKGWFSTDIEDRMRTHIVQGNIIHLQNVASNEMEYLYSHAKAFVFPSFSEGFGIPAIEAMHCECPVIASNIPALKYALGKSALYCDPYDDETIKNQLEKLLYLENAENISQDIIEQGRLKSHDYSHQRLAEQWLRVVDEIQVIDSQ